MRVKLIQLSRKRYKFSVRNTKAYKICKLYRVIFFTFFNISQPNFCNFPKFRMLFNACGYEFYYFNVFKKFDFNAIDQKSNFFLEILHII